MESEQKWQCRNRGDAAASCSSRALCIETSTLTFSDHDKKIDSCMIESETDVKKSSQLEAVNALAEQAC